MTRPVRRSAGPLYRRALAHILHVAAKRTLVDRAVVVARERYAGMFELVYGCRCLASEVLDSVLIAEPVRTLHGVVHMPRPVIGRVVAERGRDTALRRNGVRSGREHFRDIGSAQSALRRAHRRAKTRSACAHDHHVVSMVGNRVGRAEGLAARRVGLGLGGGVGHYTVAPRARRAMLNRPKAAPAIAARLSARIAANLLPGV